MSWVEVTSSELVELTKQNMDNYILKSLRLLNCLDEKKTNFSIESIFHREETNNERSCDASRNNNMYTLFNVKDYQICFFGICLISQSIRIIISYKHFHKATLKSPSHLANMSSPETDNARIIR